MKNRKKIWQVEEVGEQLKVGIIGSGSIAINLRESLLKKGCEVVLSPIFSNSFSSCKYIFQLGDFQSLLKADQYCIRHGVRLLVIETGVGKLPVSLLVKLKCKILRIGEVRAWDEKSLMESIFWAMFRAEAKGNVIDLSRESFFPAGGTTRSRKKIEWRLPSWGKYALLLFILLFPIFYFVGQVFLFAYSMRAFTLSVQEGNWGKATIYLSRAKGSLPSSELVFHIASIISRPFGSQVSISWDKLDSLAQVGVEMGEQVLQAREIFVAEISQLSLDGKGVSGNNLTKLTAIIGGIDKNLTIMIADTDAISLPFFPREVTLGRLKRAQKNVLVVRSVLPVLSGAILDNHERVYLILFQNNLELRPTGGFIGSYGLVRVKAGKLLAFNVYDVYGADGQLKAHVDPPAPIRQYLSQPNWFLRDSNFDPDFSISAQQAEWFLEKETGQRVDGVIGMNLTFLKNILDVVGPLYLPDYKDNITSDNLYLKSVVYTQRNFFAGSTAKRDFLGNLGNLLLLTITQNKHLNWQKLGQTIVASFDQKDILFYFHDETLQKTVEERGWGGRIVDLVCEERCYPDYLAVVNTNLGVNKANLYVHNHISVQKVISSEGVIESVVTVSYENASPPGAFPGGDYKDYVRLLVPRGAEVQSVTIDGVPTSDISQDSYGNDKDIIGFLVEVTALSKRKVAVTYTLPGKIIVAKRYQFLYQKQPGESDSALSIQIQFPSSWQSSPMNFAPSLTSGGYTYDTDTTVDRVFVWMLRSN